MKPAILLVLIAFLCNCSLHDESKHLDEEDELAKPSDIQYKWQNAELTSSFCCPK